MLSAGYCLLPVDFLVMAAKTRVRPPTRPVYINMINMNFETVCNVGVMPIERPTVPTADALSNNVLMKAMCSILEIDMEPDDSNHDIEHEYGNGAIDRFGG